MSKKQPEKLKIYGLYQYSASRVAPKLCLAMLNLNDLGFENPADLRIIQRGSILQIELSEQEENEKAENSDISYRPHKSTKKIKRIKTIKKL